MAYRIRTTEGYLGVKGPAGVLLVSTTWSDVPDHTWEQLPQRAALEQRPDLEVEYVPDDDAPAEIPIEVDHEDPISDEDA